MDRLNSLEEGHPEARLPTLGPRKLALCVLRLSPAAWFGALCYQLLRAGTTAVFGCTRDPAARREINYSHLRNC